MSNLQSTRMFFYIYFCIYNHRRLYLFVSILWYYLSTLQTNSTFLPQPNQKTRRFNKTRTLANWTGRNWQPNSTRSFQNFQSAVCVFGSNKIRFPFILFRLTKITADSLGFGHGDDDRVRSFWYEAWEHLDSDSDTREKQGESELRRR